MPNYIADSNGYYTFSKKLHGDEIIDLAALILESRFKRGETLSTPTIAYRYMQLQLCGLQQEVFAGAFLDTRHRLIEFEKLFYGTIDGASVYPREVVKTALGYNAAAAIFAHNHPSGVAEPSRADESLTRKLKDALGTVDVRVLDHIIVSETEYVSMAERGLL